MVISMAMNRILSTFLITHTPLGIAPLFTLTRYTYMYTGRSSLAASLRVTSLNIVGKVISAHMPGRQCLAPW